MSKVKISKEFQPLYTTDKRYILITGGRASLKSTTVHDYIVRLTYQKDRGVLFTRYTMTSAKISIIPEFEETLIRLGVHADFDITLNRVTNKRTGSFIYFSGIKSGSKDNTGRLKSISGIDTWVIEEGEDFKDEKTFNAIDDSIRSTKHPNRIIWIQNPTTRQHFIYEKFIKGSSKEKRVKGYNVTVSNHEDVEHIHTTYHLAEKLGYLDKGWIKKANDAKYEALRMEEEYKYAKKNKTEISHTGKHSSHYYYNYIGGWLERAEGAIFQNWKQGKFDDTLPFAYGLDYGYYPDPLASTKVAVDTRNKIIYLKQMIYDIEVDDIDSKLTEAGIRKRRDLIVCDTNEPRTTSRLRRLKWNIVKAIKNQVSEDIRVINTYQIIVDNTDNCSQDLIDELNNYEWNDKKASIPIDAWNHLIDNFRYAFVRLTTKRGGVKKRR